MAPIHVDESTGSDETGKGTPEAPYQSLAFALYTHPDGPYVIRKDASGTYEEPTQSALKKAKKGADGIEKKRKKAEELAEREAKEKEYADGQHANMIDGVWHCSNCGCPESIAIGRRKGPLGDKSQCGTCGKSAVRPARASGN